MSRMPAELSADRLRAQCDPATLPADSTADIDIEIGIIGQPRAARAIDFALGVDAVGYNLYVAGEPGTGRNTSVLIAVNKAAEAGTVPDDWCYVHNFATPDTPGALRLPAGKGCAFQRDMEALLEELKEEIPKAFEGRAYEERRAQLVKDLHEKRDKLFERFKAEAQEREFAVEQSGGGILTLPVKNGKPMSSQDWEGLSDDEKQDLETRQEDLQQVMREITRQVRELEKEAKSRLNSLECEIANHPLRAAVDELKEKYGDYEGVLTYLEEVRKDVLANLDDFKEEPEQPMPIPGLRAPRSSESLLRYRVNTIVDNGSLEGAPVIVETNPSFYNLVGRLEYRSTMGTMTTDFAMIKAGALHMANGGFLVLQALDVLRNYMAWDALKRAIRSGLIHLEDMNEQFRVIQTQSLKPEPIPLNVKVILVGSPLLYLLLHQYDEDFQKLFKVKADFGVEMALEDEGLNDYVGYMAKRVLDEGMLHFDRGAMAEVIEFAGRLADDQEKLTTKFNQIADLMRESEYFARAEQAETVSTEHVRTAIREKIFRSNRIEERLQEMITEGTILVDTDGQIVGQINGLAVLDQGDYQFGKPSRLTARVYSGRAGIVQIDRDTNMAGSIHNKGVKILEGFFGDRYAHESPISFTASLTFEQLYGGVDGDSASSTELYSLLSALARVPIRQDLAVTGSVNQRGEVQAIGGVNEKIEGWFYTCRAKELTGTQGVLVPESNVRHLMLNDDVVDAVQEGRFHIYPIGHIDEGIELLTGMPAGEPDEDGKYPVGSINYRVAKRLESLSEGLRAAMGGPGGNGNATSSV